MNLSLYLVTNRKDMPLELFFEKIERAIEGGVTIVQLREKNTPFLEFVKIARELKSRIKVPLIINDRVDVALAAGADGVHLGQSDHQVQEARQVLGNKAIIGLSIETIEQAEKAISEKVDYLAVSPVFPTSTKSDCAAHMGIEGLKNVIAVSPFPVIAIGGINSANAHQIFDAGAKGIAIVSAIFDAPCPKIAAQNLKRARHGV